MENQSNNNEPNRPDDFLRFYKSYFIDYWEMKYKLLTHEIDNFDIQKQKLAEINGFFFIYKFVIRRNFVSNKIEKWERDRFAYDR